MKKDFLSREWNFNIVNKATRVNDFVTYNDIRDTKFYILIRDKWEKLLVRAEPLRLSKLEHIKDKKYPFSLLLSKLERNNSFRIPGIKTNGYPTLCLQTLRYYLRFLHTCYACNKFFLTIVAQCKSN